MHTIVYLSWTLMLLIERKWRVQWCKYFGFIFPQEIEWAAWEKVTLVVSRGLKQTWLNIGIKRHPQSRVYIPIQYDTYPKSFSLTTLTSALMALRVIERRIQECNPWVEKSSWSVPGDIVSRYRRV